MTILPRVNNDQGFVLALSMSIMAVLVILGAFAIQTTNIELKIAGSDASRREAFYQADGGVEVGTEVLEQNIACISGFSDTDGTGALLGAADDPDKYGSGAYIPGWALNFWQNQVALDGGGNIIPRYPERGFIPPADWEAAGPQTTDLYFPADYSADDPRTLVSFTGETKMGKGAAIQMAAGYEGKGKGLGSGGSYLLYQIYSTHIGHKNAAAMVRVQWRHSIGTEGTCYY